MAQLFKDVNASLFLCQMLYWYGKGKLADGWIYKESKDITQGTGLSYEQQLAQGPHCRDNGRRVSTWTPPAEVGASLSFEFAAREPCEWEGALDRLLSHVCAHLGTRSARTIEVRLETPVVPLCARRILKEPLGEAKALRAPVLAALSEALSMLAPLPPVITKLEVRLGALSCAPVQASLFEGDEAEKVERPGRLRATLESMEARFAGKSGHFVAGEVDSPFPEEQWRLDPASGWLPALESLQKRRKTESHRTEPRRTRAK